MLIRCWGARGSIPVCGREYLKYGGDTTCMEVRADDGPVVVVDAGSGIRRLGGRLLDEGAAEIHLLLTHAHWDHLIGLPFFKPLHQAGVAIHIYGCSSAQASVEEIVSETMAPPRFPMPLDRAEAALSFHARCDEAFEIGRLRITSTRASHPNEALGYRFEQDGRKFVFLTDNELRYRHPGGKTFDDYADFCRGADLLIHDAEFTDAEYERTRRWGHSRFTDAVELALQAGVKALGLFHHNAERTDEQVDEIVSACRELIAGSGRAVECFAVAAGTERRL